MYEPRTFVLSEGPDGCPTLAFTPDFHLPDADIYVEVTTLKQRLVTKKNHKVRLLRQRYPHVDVRILYERDYHQLLTKYGLEPPSQWSGHRVGAPSTEAGSLLDSPRPSLDHAAERPTSAA